MISVVVANPLHYIIGGFYFGTLGNATAYSILPISDGGLKYFFIYRETLSAIKERQQEGCLAVEMECASMLAVSKYRHIPFIQFLYGADNLSSETWEIRDLTSYGLTNAEKYMVLAFECGLAM